MQLHAIGDKFYLHRSHF